MYKFSKKSESQLRTCHSNLKILMLSVLKRIDISIVCGYRTKEEQEKAFEEGKSYAKWGESFHNKRPSCAIDIAPYTNGIDFEDIEVFNYMATIVFDEAQKLGLKIKWGGHFENLKDYGHFELTKI